MSPRTGYPSPPAAFAQYALVALQSALRSIFLFWALSHLVILVTAVIVASALSFDPPYPTCL